MEEFQTETEWETSHDRGFVIKGNIMVKWMRYSYPTEGMYSMYHAVGQDGWPVCGRGTHIRLGGDNVEVLENVEDVDISRQFCSYCEGEIGPVRPLTEEEIEKQMRDADEAYRLLEEAREARRVKRLTLTGRT
jgi:hypothetical protein